MARILISAGEVSGDVVGARLARALHRAEPDAHLFGIGGDRMASAGVQVLFRTNHLGTVGVTEAMSTLPSLLRAFRLLRRAVRESRPHAAVLIANDVFNVVLGRWLRGQGVRTIAYFPPQVWVWRAVARWIAPSFDLILASFPEELTVYRSVRPSPRVEFVGHYVADELAPVTPAARAEARAGCGFEGPGRVVALLPGSRGHEVRLLAPVLVEAAALMLARDPALRFVMPVAEPALAGCIEGVMAAMRMTDRVRLTRDSHAAMRAADVVLTASGTASLEAAALAVPMVIVYRVAPVTNAVVRACIRLGLMREYVSGLPNLILGRPAVPEVLQSDATAQTTATEAWRLLDDPEARERMRESLLEASERVRAAGTIERLATAVLEESMRGRSRVQDATGDGVGSPTFVSGARRPSCSSPDASLPNPPALGRQLD
jgi:lipid-A-disaccharide synthase